MISGLVSSRAKPIIDFPFLEDERDCLPISLRESCFRGTAGFKVGPFADVSAEINRLLLGEVGVEGFLSGPLGLEAVFCELGTV